MTHTLAALGVALGLTSTAALASPDEPGCESLTAKACVEQAMTAMGGRTALADIHSVEVEAIGHTLLTEQSYRQAPFITAYDRTTQTIDFDKGRINTSDKGLWPESDPGVAAAENDAVLVATANAAVIRAGDKDQRAGLSSIDDARAALELGPERLLLTAAAAPDLHFAAPATLRATPHAVVAFQWRGAEVRVLLGGFNHLPDATESTRTFNDFWFAWGDVTQRVYFDNFKLIGGVVYPTNRVEERNGIVWSSSQILDAKFNPPLDEKAFAMDPAAAAASAAGKGWNRSFDASHHTELAPGVDLYQGSWNVAVIRQDDGVLVLEAPISPSFTQGALAKARADNPGRPIKAVLTTSDSWPHLAGVRQAVAEGLPVYGLDLNRPILERLVAAPHTLAPDALQTAPKKPDWRWVAGPTAIGTGLNRMVLYPLRGAATERQYMVYFPGRRLLYASDTLVLSADGKTICDPELTSEVAQAVAREHLAVDTVWAMHQAPAPWSEVVRFIEGVKGA